MEFKLAYLEAMRTQAPQMFNRLRKTGALDAHLEQKTKEAYRMLSEQTASLEKLPSGMPKDQAALRQAEESVLATLIEFPSEDSAEAQTP